MVDNGNLGALYSIASKFPKVIEYRDKLEYSRSIDRYLMLIGGSITERDACIDYITRPPFEELSVFSSLNNSEKFERVIIDFAKGSNLSSGLSLTNLQKISDLKLGISSLNSGKLFVLKGITGGFNDVLHELAHALNHSVKRPNFLIVTVESKYDLKELDQTWEAMFEKIDITTMKKRKACKKNYPSRYDVDTILEHYVKKYPEESRVFIVRKAEPSIKKMFEGKDLYKRSTLITRVSVIRNKLSNSIVISACVIINSLYSVEIRSLFWPF